MTHNQDHKNQIAVQRAADDLRRGWPAIVCDGPDALVLMPAEMASAPALARFSALSQASPAIYVTKNRAQALKVAHKGDPVVALDFASWLTPADIIALADPTLDLSTPFKGPFHRAEAASTRTAEAAIKLVKIARLLPAFIGTVLTKAAADTLAAGHDILTVQADCVLTTDQDQSNSLKIVASAKVPLEASTETRLISFRPDHGSIEHIAIVVGDPNRHDPVLARLHSECFTGDLLGSLKCDCGDQLKGAIRHIAEAGGGLVLYMAQEGRGIGLTSKLKAYALQDQGYDTVDANTALGFEIDERFFAPAAEMLRTLGFEKVRLMTNNPNKVEALKSFGIDIVERVAHQFPTNPHNENYLSTKAEKTGHILR